MGSIFQDRITSLCSKQSGEMRVPPFPSICNESQSSQIERTRRHNTACAASCFINPTYVSPSGGACRSSVFI